MLRAVEPRLTGRRRALAAASLGVLALTQAIVGGWALLGPAHFYARFPAAGHAWVALLPPYNEHLVRDVGALSCALVVLLGAAAATGRRDLVRIAATAFAVYTIPHTLFHGVHLDGFGRTDAVSQMAGFVGQLVLAGLALAVTLPGRRDSRARD